jgi:hypothetical protein
MASWPSSDNMAAQTHDGRGNRNWRTIDDIGHFTFPLENAVQPIWPASTKESGYSRNRLSRPQQSHCRLGIIHNVKEPAQTG